MIDKCKADIEAGKNQKFARLEGGMWGLMIKKWTKVYKATPR